MSGREEGREGKGESDHTGEEGWEMEVCNWLPGEDYPVCLQPLPQP